MRTNKLPKPGLQFRLSMFFVSITCVAAMFQVFLINRALYDIARILPNDQEQVLDALPDVFYSGIAWTVFVLMPVMLMFGMFVTFRIAGPVRRMEQHLDDIASGKEVGDCQLRARDELHDLCDAFNRGIRALRERSGATDASNAPCSEPSDLETARN